MTVCVGVAVNDCLVFAADSASSLVTTDLASGSSQIANVFSHGEKVYNLYKRLPIVAMTCGMGNVGTASIATLAKDLRRRMMGNDPAWAIDRANYTLADVADKARRLFFDERYQALNPPPPAPHSFEFWIGGYSSDFDAGHEVWKISIENGNCPPPKRWWVMAMQGSSTGAARSYQSACDWLRSCPCGHSNLRWDRSECQPADGKFPAPALGEPACLADHAGERCH